MAKQKQPRRLRYFGPVPSYFGQPETPGRLIVVEGTDGVGRTTHVERLREWIEVQGHAVVDTGWDTHQQIFKALPDALFPGSGRLPVNSRATRRMKLQGLRIK